LIELGIDETGLRGPGLSLPDDSTDVTSDFRPGTGVLGSIAARIGSVSQVLLRDTAPVEEPGPVFQPQAADPVSPGIRYRIVGEIGRGGMGAVLKGHDPDLGRDVALKVLREDHRDKADMVRRFVEEAQIGGQLQHPGVVPIYELGTFTDHRPFFSMKLVKGHTLAELLDERDSPADDLPRFLSIYQAICQTVAYAHSRGVIHRDLKPSNVMVGSFGEVQVMDWGLAKVLSRGGALDDAQTETAGDRETVIATARSGSSSTERSQAGMVMGTPSYMAPEQARGELDHVDERADVFALGSILCEILTGEPAFLGISAGDVHRKAVEGDLADAAARLEGCGADAELIALARDCLAREAADRPRKAGAVAERMTAYLTGVQERLRAAEMAKAAESARAEEASRTAAEANERARAERRARRFQVGLAASLLVLTTAGGLTFTYLLQLSQARAARRDHVLAETTALVIKARRDAGDPVPWREAMAALGKVEGLGSEPRIENLRTEIEAGVGEAERVAKLLQELVEIRANEEEVGIDVTDAAYTAAFRAAELDLETLEPAELARRLRRLPEADVVELAAFLDDWSGMRRWAGRPISTWRRPMEAARLADSDSYRDGFRALFLVERRKLEVEKLKDMATAPEAAGLPAASAVLLGRALLRLGQAEAAVALLRLAAGRLPDDLWINYTLAGALVVPPRSAREEAVRYYTAARALRPETAHDLAHLLADIGRGAEAEAVFRDLTDRRPSDSRHLVCLGLQLKHNGRVPEAAEVLDRAIAAATEAVTINPADTAAHNHLGLALMEQGKLDDAVAEFRRATRLQPNDAGAHSNLGNALRQQGKLDDAVAEFRTAIRLKPDFAGAHNNLGGTMKVQGKLDDAVAEYRESIRLKPDYAEAHHNLGHVLSDQGKLDDAVAEFRAAIQPRPNDPEVHNDLGYSLRQQGKLDDAVAECRSAIRLKADYAPPHQNLGLALALQGKLDEAIAAYQEAIRLKPDFVEAHNDLGSLRCDKKHDYVGAMVEFREAIRLKPDFAPAHYNLGLALAAQGKLDDTIAEFGAAIRLKHDYAGAHYNLGTALHLKGKLDDAVSEYREAIRLKADYVEAHTNLGNALREQGKLDDAIAECRKAIQLKPDDAEPHSSLGAILCDLKHDYTGAEAEFRQAIRLKPDFAPAHYNLGNALWNQGKKDHAIAALREAIRLKPDYTEAHYNLGYVLTDQGKLDDAISEYRAAIQLKPDDAKARYDLGNALREQGKLDSAVAEYREAIRLKSDYADAHHNLGHVLRDQGKLDDAVAEFRAAIQTRPNDPDVHNDLGNALTAQGKLDGAVAEYREAIRLKPDYAEAHYSLGLALHRQGKLDDAVIEFREAIRLKADYAEARYSLGLALTAQGKLDDAVAEYRAAIQLKPDYAEAHYSLGLALSRQGKLDDAVAAYRAAIRLKPDYAEAHCNLGHLLRSQGDYAEALTELRKGHELGSKQGDWRYPSALWVQQAEQSAALAGRLTAILKGDDCPRDTSERLAFAQMCYDSKRHAAATRFWSESLAADPKLGDDRQAGHRYNGACAAALAAAGEGKDHPAPDDAAKAKLRAQALEWLTAELAAWAKVFQTGDPKSSAQVAGTLGHWKEDIDLAGIRDASSLEKLPEAERQAWRALWTDVDTLLGKTGVPRR
jgi:tetratricopeptide (TPR) repeat protein/tRNA A-37 threonylcarbamoyl transferase component Bud32